jgi:hypothetical protein
LLLVEQPGVALLSAKSGGEKQIAAGAFNGGGNN